ncbi:acetylxylan esterase [Candidatus Sumerlaeota bacterium]|nr:acetylxylan esterase [Candidatus Sumerlaeota bacterium]
MGILIACANIFAQGNMPDPLTMSDGRSVQTPTAWRTERGPEILELFRKYVYGRTPDKPFTLKATVAEKSPNVFEGKVSRKQVSLDIRHEGKNLAIDLLIYLPKGREGKPVPVFTLLNFGGNHTTHPAPEIPLPKSHVRENYSPPEKFRGAKSSRFPIEEICARGYGLVTAYYGDIDPDFHDGFANGAHGLLDAQNERRDDSWGAVSAWAWGLSRIMDYLQTDDEVDHDRIAVLGHSRLGKTALWAGAQDERFSIVISNCSGCSGAAISRRRKGETLKDINKNFPHWFCENYKRFNDREEELPVDQHLLIALIAPRPVYVASATLDKWADPEGEFLACVLASPVYKLLGFDGVGANALPNPDTPLFKGRIGYHIRTGKHDLTSYDWKCFMDFADIHWGASLSRK